MLKTTTFIFTIVFIIFISPLISATESQPFTEISFYFHHEEKQPSLIKRKASFFPASANKAVILAHQWGAPKESWYFFSKILQKQNIPSVVLYDSGTDDVLGAVGYLKGKGYKDILLVGASIGGGAIMRAISTAPDPAISKIILLAPGAGPAVKAPDIKKLVIVAKQDFYKKFAYDAFSESVQPKQLKEYSGTEHAQGLFKGPHREDLISTLLKFLRD